MATGRRAQLCGAQRTLRAAARRHEPFQRSSTSISQWECRGLARCGPSASAGRARSAPTRLCRPPCGAGPPSDERIHDVLPHCLARPPHPPHSSLQVRLRLQHHPPPRRRLRLWDAVVEVARATQRRPCLLRQLAWRRPSTPAASNAGVAVGAAVLPRGSRGHRRSSFSEPVHLLWKSPARPDLAQLGRPTRFPPHRWLLSSGRHS
mmetsp:Transcript_4056/g.15654  ORF Transcript_4056/g.15654 Transcript_4056/m.15654 type:complete len:206 (+) Transcript_4056:1830-2447(+)